MNIKAVLVSAAMAATVMGAQCSQSSAPNASDSLRIVRLEAEARDIAKTDGCTGADQCRSAPVGDRACGGPRTYIVYCARTTDSVALYRKLDELKAAEREFNTKSGRMSTCEFRLPPTVGLTGGQCAALVP